MATAPDPRTITVEGGQVITDEIRRAEARKRAAAFNRYRVIIHVGDPEDGGEHRTYVFTAGEVSARHVGLLRERADTELLDPVAYALTYSAIRPPALDAVAWLIYLARLQAGERPDFDAVVDGLTAATPVWLDFSEEGGLPRRDGEVQFPDPPSSAGAPDL